jgi:putative transport protein
LSCAIFFATIGATGITFLLYGAAIVLALVLITAACCLWLFRLPFDTTVRVVAGATGNSAIPAFASRVVLTEQPDVGYAMIFPSMTVANILFVQIAALLLAK